MSVTVLESAIRPVAGPDEAELAEQFDAVLHVDETRAVEKLGRTSEWEAPRAAGDLPLGGLVPLSVMVSHFWRLHEVARQGHREARYAVISGRLSTQHGGVVLRQK
jgi:hypothetical protein